VQFLVVLLLLTAIVVFITVPLRRRHAAAESAAAADAERAVDDLEAAREAKYREIRDAELDHATGKLSDADFQVLDRSLRAEAIGILKALDHARERLASVAGARDAAEPPRDPG
jgi:flagellar biosynthesis/type III secretory pathway M-ring protein FliF/YscJ